MHPKAKPLVFPEKVLDQHLVILGKTGAGKSSALRHIAEHQLAAVKRVCVIDPKGDWWGLKASADGKAAGFPVIAFGDFKNEAAGDVPINERSGKHVAELVATGNRPCVIGFRGWMPEEMHRFWIDFASTLFALNAGELYLFIDECHNFAPKGKLLSVDAAKSLHWTNRLLSEGRGLGIVCLDASQRPQKVHNDTLTSHETLVAMRVIHKADRDAVKDWLDGAGDAALGREVLAALAQMPRGTGYVWSPEIGFGPTRLSFPMFVTFDSFAPPQVQKKVSRASWADVNLDDVKTKLAAVIEEEKANDPKELRAQIKQLQAELAKKPAAAAAVKVEQKLIEKPVITDAQLSRAEALVQQLDALLVKTHAAVTEIAVGRAEVFRWRAPVPTAPVVPRQPSPIAPRKLVATSSSDVGNGGLRRILIALAQRPGLTNRQIGVRAGLSSNSGSFSTYLSKGRSSGWIRDEGDRRFITDEGLAALGSYEPLPTGNALLQHWLSELGNSGAARILSALAAAYPIGLSNEEIGQAAGISHSSGSFSTYMSRLRTLELVQGSRGATVASSELFD